MKSFIFLILLFHTLSSQSQIFNGPADMYGGDKKQLKDSLNYLDSVIMENQYHVFEIKLPSSTTVAGRIAGATSGTDYPADWSLAAGTSPVDLVVTHNLGRRVSIVSVFAIDGTQETQLFNTAAFNGIVTPDVNTLRVQSLATIQKAIKIYIIFK